MAVMMSRVCDVYGTETYTKCSSKTSSNYLEDERGDRMIL
jgi:hypothetical protein